MGEGEDVAGAGDGGEGGVGEGVWVGEDAVVGAVDLKEGAGEGWSSLPSEEFAEGPFEKAGIGEGELVGEWGGGGG